MAHVLCVVMQWCAALRSTKIESRSGLNVYKTPDVDDRKDSFMCIIVICVTPRVILAICISCIYGKCGINICHTAVEHWNTIVMAFEHDSYCQQA